MKKRTVCSAALLALMGAGFIIPSTASAAPEYVDATHAKGSGTIDFKEDDGGDNPIVDPEKPTEPITPPVNPNTNKGPLKIDLVTDLDFKSQTASLSDQTYFAERVAIKDEVGNDKGYRGNFVQITDARIDKRTKWTLSAKLEQQFKAESGNILTGSTLNFTNGIMESKTDPASSARPKFTGAAFKLTEKGGAEPIANTDAVADGFGTYSFEYGQSKDYPGITEDTTGTPSEKDSNKIENGSVELMVPGNVAKTKEKYEAKILWALEVTP